MSDTLLTLEESLERGYTREDLILLGELVDVTGIARDLGYRVPVALTAPLHDECLRHATSSHPSNLVVTDMLKVLAPTILAEQHRPVYQFLMPGWTCILTAVVEETDDWEAGERALTIGLTEV